MHDSVHDGVHGAEILLLHNKNGQTEKVCPSFCVVQSDGARYLAGAQATRANANGLVRAVIIYANLSDIGLPSSRGLALGVRYIVTERNALTADTAFCH